MRREKIERKKLKRRRREREGFKSPSLHFSRETKQGVLVVFLFAVALLGLLSLLDIAGALGRWMESGLGVLFGWTRVAVPLLFLILGYVFLYPERYTVRLLHLVGLGCLLLSIQGGLHLFIPLPQAVDAALAAEGGGYLGFIASYPLQRIAGFPATVLILLALFIVGLLLTFETSLVRLAEHSRSTLGLFRWMRMRWLSYKYRGEGRSTSDDRAMIGFDEREIQEGKEREDVKGREETTTTFERGEGEKEQLAIFTTPKRALRKVAIPLDLFESEGGKPTSGDIAESAAVIERTLKNFGIDVTMGDIAVGPTVTQYTLKPAEGVRLSAITALANDLALALAAHPIRIEAPIPGKALVGIEVPNERVATVRFGELLRSDAFQKRSSNLMIALGKDVSGKPWVVDITRMPHLLVAGATGSGKSVCLNAIILSLLYENGPDQCKFIFVDPKRVELTVYNGIPHLLTPVVTDVKKTVNALKWLLQEMDRRFEKLSQSRKRDIASYNQSGDDFMPYIVLVIDELADLMVAAASEVEAAIIRLAQMARAVGIHLVVATQRPSVDVITGLIKANITSRVAFSVASQMDSRTILDVSGAEKLLGRGDMLFTSAELSKPKRLQGSFVSEQEIQRVVAYLVQRGGEAAYDTTIVEAKRQTSGEFSDGDGDPLLAEAKDVILQAGKASASLLQRRLKLGYARAARILDLLEEEGFIGPGDGAKPREILFQGGADDRIEVFGDREEDAGDEEGESSFAEASEDREEEDDDEESEEGDDEEEDEDDEEEGDDEGRLNDEKFEDAQEGEYEKDEELEIRN